jgi:hypothetical protein
MRCPYRVRRDREPVLGELRRRHAGCWRRSECSLEGQQQSWRPR